MPFKPLPVLVSDKANKNAGAALPKKPTPNTAKYLLRGIDFTALNTKGKVTKQEMPTRKQATSIGEKPISDFLIKM